MPEGSAARRPSTGEPARTDHLETVPGAVHRKRIGILGWIWVAAFLAIVVRLFDIQVIGRERYTARAIGQQERQIVIDARRGRILDRDGIDLAISLPAASVAVNPRKVADSRHIATRISRVTQEPVPAILRRIDRQDRSFAWVARNTDRTIAQQIQDIDPGAFMLLNGSRRIHPLAALAGQVLGHVNIDNIGADGVELRFENELRGQDGWVRTLVDALGDPVPNTAEQSKRAVDGMNLYLTIDADYQAIVEHELAMAVERTGAQSGSALLYEAETGAIRAMANVPLYSPSDFRDATAPNRRNRAISDPYEPGSTFKVVAAAATLAERVIAPEDSVDCQGGSIVVAGQTIRDSQRHGQLTFREVISLSSNVGTIKAANLLNSDDLYRYIRRFGFGAETGVDLPGESKGILRPTSQWSGRSHATLAIGQEIGVTALQIASAYGALANDGWLMVPRIHERLETVQGEVVHKNEPRYVRQVVSADVARTMVDILCEVVDGGTGANARIAGLRVAGKTGTAQIARSDGRGYEQGAYTASFVGFLPDMDPTLVCVVSISRPKGVHYGSAVAAPVFRRIMGRILSRDTSTIPQALIADTRRMPNLIGMSRTDALHALDMIGAESVASGTGSVVVGQWPPASARVPENGAVEIVTADHNAIEPTVPDVRNLPVRQAISMLRAHGLNIELRGTGIVAWQAPAPGSRPPQNGTIIVSCSERDWTRDMRRPL